MGKESPLPADWYKKGDADLQTVELLLEHGGDLGIAASHIQQAAEKYLKGFLLSKGWALKKTHDLSELLDYAVEYDKGLDKFRDICQEYTVFYFEARYPFFQEGPGKKEIQKALKKGKELIYALLESK
jgi:HEPN domain-containing protein